MIPFFNKLQRRIQIGLVMSFCALNFACSSQEVKVSKIYDPRVPYRVAVIPFMDVSSGDAVPSKLWTAGLDSTPYLSDDRLVKENAATIVRQRAFASLQRSHFDLVNMDIIDSLLQRRGFSSTKIYKAERAEAAKKIGNALGVDAVLFGEVIEWDRSYYGVETVVSVGVRFSLRDTSSGAILSAGEIIETKQSGVSRLPISTTPVGVAQSVGVASLKGLSNKAFLDLTNTVSSKFAAGLIPSAEAQAKSKLPEIYFVAHDIRSPSAFNKVVSVVAKGSPGLKASAFLGNQPRRLMTETSPGTYFIELAGSALPSGKFKISVKLINKTLRATRMTVSVPVVNPKS